MMAHTPSFSLSRALSLPLLSHPKIKTTPTKLQGKKLPSKRTLGDKEQDFIEAMKVSFWEGTRPILSLFFFDST